MPAGHIETKGLMLPMQWRDLPGGSVLITALNDLFLLFNPRAAMVEPLSGGPIGMVYQIIPLKDRGILVHAAKGLFIAPALPVDQAKVRLLRPERVNRDAVSADSIEVVVAFEHPCATVADGLGLEMQMTLGGKTGTPVPVHVPFRNPPTTTVAQLAANFVFDKPGSATLQLRRGSQPIGPPFAFTVAEASLLERLASAWKWLSGIAVAIYAVAFTVLVILAHRSTTAFRLLTDAAWAKWLTWPFFFLRHVPAVQRWILEPWFQNVRQATATEVQFLDPPVERAGAQMEASTLLDRLRKVRRLWLQGGSGMGKSSVFAAWERAFYTSAATPTLAATVKHYGFVLVPLRLREYAGLAAPNAHRPESWLIEAVRRRFEQSGMPMQDPELVAAMLMTGHLALALDGINETDRDTAIDAFASQFPMVPMLVTSQARGGTEWETWQLPADIRGLASGLLGLWLGPTAGEALVHRLADQGLIDSIVSGYDLRLLADLAAKDPEHADLPTNRVALYRAMLAHAANFANEPLHLEGLKRLAWSMLVERHRREILPEDGTVLGTGTLQALAKDGVRIVRQRGAAYEFRHDQMRAFLAALWLTEETPSQVALQDAILSANVFALSRLDQEGLWGFVVLLLDKQVLVSLWQFASSDPAGRSLLLASLQREADRRGLQLVRLPSIRRMPAGKTTDRAGK